MQYSTDMVWSLQSVASEYMGLLFVNTLADVFSPHETACSSTKVVVVVVVAN